MVFRNCLKCSSLLVFDIWHTRCCTGLPSDIGDVGTLGIPIPPRDQASDRGRCTRSVHGGASDAVARHSCVAVLASASAGMSLAVVIDHRPPHALEAGGDPYDRSALRPLGPECGLGAHA